MRTITLTLKLRVESIEENVENKILRLINDYTEYGVSCESYESSESEISSDEESSEEETSEEESSEISESSSDDEESSEEEKEI